MSEAAWFGLPTGHAWSDARDYEGELAPCLPPLPALPPAFLVWAGCDFPASRCSQKLSGSALGAARLVLVVKLPMLEVGQPLSPLIHEVKGNWAHSVLCVLWLECEVWIGLRSEY